MAGMITRSVYVTRRLDCSGVPWCAMSTIVYRFDDVGSFPLLESETTVRKPVTVSVEGRGEEAFLRIAAQRQANDMPEVVVMIGLPLLAIDGDPQQLLLEVLGDASGCGLFLEAGDARGWGFAYAFGPVDFSGWRTCTVDVQRPSECWGQCKEEGACRVVPPVQPFRLGIGLGKRCDAIDIGLRTLRVVGEAHLAPPGIASAG